MKTILFSCRNPEKNTFGLPFMINFSNDQNYVLSELNRYIDIGICSYTSDLCDLYNTEGADKHFYFTLECFVRFYRSNLISFGTFDETEGFQPYSLYDFYVPTFCDNPLKYFDGERFSNDSKLIEIVKGAFSENTCIQ